MAQQNTKHGSTKGNQSPSFNKKLNHFPYSLTDVNEEMESAIEVLNSTDKAHNKVSRELVWAEELLVKAEEEHRRGKIEIFDIINERLHVISVHHEKIEAQERWVQAQIALLAVQQKMATIIAK